MENFNINMIELPPMPQVVSKIIQIDENNIDLSSNQIQNIISVDPGLTAKILKLANSAFYARSKKIDNLAQALTLLGFKTIKSLTLLVSVAAVMHQNGSNSQIQKELWMHSVLAGFISKIIAEKTGNRKQNEESFVCGLLKNIGQLILHNRFPNAFETVIKKCAASSDPNCFHLLEKETFGITSTEISVKAMKEWNFPDNIAKVSGLTSKDYNEVFEKGGILAIYTVLAEAVIYLQDFFNEEIINDKMNLYYKTLFESYTKKLNIDNTTKDYLTGNLKKHIKNNDFFQFCEEVFSM
ncbi:MAG: HDOD domain-containing protein [Spirochaetia bacterium]|nr:HDOD domain-containing protein [Spirochaetia bacterium]